MGFPTKLEAVVREITVPELADLEREVQEQVSTLVVYEGIPLVDEEKTLSAVGQALAAAEKDAVGVAARLERLKKGLDGLQVADSASLSVQAASVREKIGEVAADLRKFAAGQAGEEVQLYEIVSDEGSIDFRRVLLE